VPERLHDVQPGRDADVRVAALLVTEGLRLLELLLDQVRQFEILEHEVEELLAGYLEGEIVQTLAGVAGLATATALPAHRAFYPVAGDELPVAGQDAPLPAAAAVPEDGLRDVFPGNADLIPAIGVGDAPFVDSVGDGFLDVLPEAAQETLPVDGALVAAFFPAVDDQERHCRPSTQQRPRTCSPGILSADESVRTPAARRRFDVARLFASGCTGSPRLADSQVPLR